MGEANKTVQRVIIDIEKLTAAVETYRAARARHDAAEIALKAAQEEEQAARTSMSRAEGDVNDEFDRIISGDA